MKSFDMFCQNQLFISFAHSLTMYTLTSWNDIKLKRAKIIGEKSLNWAHSLNRCLTIHWFFRSRWNQLLINWCWEFLSKSWGIFFSCKNFQQNNFYKPSFFGVTNSRQLVDDKKKLLVKRKKCLMSTKQINRKTWREENWMKHLQWVEK